MAPSDSAAAMRLWASVDLAVTGAFALPPVAPVFVDGLYWMDRALGGTATAPAFAPVHWLFVCLAGALGVLWAAVRLRHPVAHLGRADAFARLWVAALLLYFLFAGAPRVLFAFVLTEVAGSLHQLRALRGDAIAPDA